MINDATYLEAVKATVAFETQRWWVQDYQLTESAGEIATMAQAWLDQDLPVTTYYLL